MIDGTPVNTRAGNVRNDPPPATAFISPAPRAAATRIMSAAIRRSYCGESSVATAPGSDLVQRMTAVSFLEFPDAGRLSLLKQGIDIIDIGDRRNVHRKEVCPRVLEG